MQPDFIVLEDAVTFGRQLRHRFRVMLLFGAPLLAQASVGNEDLQKQYGDKILTLRHFYPGDHLRFDAKGGAATTAQPGAWTLHGQVRVRDISLKDGMLHIRGQRLFLFLDPETGQLRDLGTVTKNDRAMKLFSKKKLDEWVAKETKTEIDVECPVAQPEMSDVNQVMNAVFLAPEEPISDLVPDYWKAWLRPKTDPKKESAAAPSQTGAIFRVGGGVSPLHANYSPDPAYAELARQAGYQTVVVLWLAVGPDGLPHNILIARPGGMELDEMAVNAVQTWKFDPARKDGIAVAVMINVEVSFKLY